MLPRVRRLTQPGDFTRAFRGGARAGGHTVIVHVRRVPATDPPGSTRVGFVVSKKVGNAVTRNRVKRRLRHLVAPLNAPCRADVVVRALPAAASHPEALAEDLVATWRRAFRKATA